MKRVRKNPRNKKWMVGIATAVLVLSASSAWFSSCHSNKVTGQLDHGVIEYAITFPFYEKGGLMSGMLPQKTTLSFTHEQGVTELSAGMGVFRTNIITNNTSKRMDYHLSLLGKKLVAKIGPRDLRTFMDDAGVVTLIHTDVVDTIAGYPCKKAIAIFHQLDKPEIELYYTDRINIKDPNWYNPFNEIPGVLLRYEVDQHDLRMRLEATSVVEVDVDPTKFEVLKDHQQVSPERIQHELHEVLSTFSL